MKFSSTLFFLMVMFGMTSMAQNHWMPHVVLGSSNVNTKSPGASFDYNGQFSYGLGLFWQHDFTDVMSIRTGMDFNMLSAKTTFMNVDYTNRTPVLSIPVQFMGRWGNEKVKFAIGFGPSVAFKLGGEVKTNSTSYEYSFGSADGKYTRANLNLIPFAGIDLNDKFGIYVNYSVEALNSQHGNDYSTKWSQIGVLLGFYL